MRSMICGLGALFVVSAAALSLLLIGTHNSWDSGMHLVVASDGDPHDS